MKKTVLFTAIIAASAIGGVVWQADRSTREDSPVLATAPTQHVQSNSMAQADGTSKTHFFDNIHVGSIVDRRTVINGIKVPPMPDAKINNATIAGVDSDNNGVRDDVDRAIAEQSGGDMQVYREMIDVAKALQYYIVNPSKQTSDQYWDALECHTHEVMKKLNAIERITLSTKARASTSGEFGAGDLVPIRTGCANGVR